MRTKSVIIWSMGTGGRCGKRRKFQTKKKLYSQWSDRKAVRTKNKEFEKQKGRESISSRLFVCVLYCPQKSRYRIYQHGPGDCLGYCVVIFPTWRDSFPTQIQQRRRAQQSLLQAEHSVDWHSGEYDLFTASGYICQSKMQSIRSGIQAFGAVRNLLQMI